WNIHNESWFKDDYVDALKLRASYGSSGNRPSSLYPQYDLYAISAAASYDGDPGALISQLGNRNLTWEKTMTTGIGVDAAFLNNRIRTTVDFYSKDTDNVLYHVPISGLSGVTRVWENISDMKNKVSDFSIARDIIHTNEWLWSLAVIVGHNVHKFTIFVQTRKADGSSWVHPVN